MGTSDASYRFAVAMFVLCLVCLMGMLAIWLGYVWGPELSVHDVGSPQLRAFA